MFEIATKGRNIEVERQKQDIDNLFIEILQEIQKRADDNKFSFYVKLQNDLHREAMDYLLGLLDTEGFDATAESSNRVYVTWYKIRKQKKSPGPSLIQSLKNILARIKAKKNANS